MTQINKASNCFLIISSLCCDESIKTTSLPSPVPASMTCSLSVSKIDVIDVDGSKDPSSSGKIVRCELLFKHSLLLPFSVVVAFTADEEFLCDSACSFKTGNDVQGDNV